MTSRIVHRVVLLGAMLVASACTSSDAPGRSAVDEPGAAFYAELTFEVAPDPDDPLAVLDRGVSLVRWWYAPDPDRWRWEIETTGSILDDGVLLTLFDGDETWGYDDRSNTYQRAVYPAFPEGYIPSPSFSARLGPANVPTVDDFIEALGGLPSGAGIQITGEAEVLGRPTQVIELRPAWRGSSTSADAPEAGETPEPAASGGETSGGVIRIFIDPERMFVMRWAVDGEGGGQSYLAEVAALDYATVIDPTLLTFEPPPGAREIDAPEDGSCGVSSGTLGGSGAPRQPGFLAPTYIPAGYGSSGSSTESGVGCEIPATAVLFQSMDNAYLTLRQRIRPTGVPATAASWPALDRVALDDAHQTSEDGITRLLWRHNDVVALLESNTLPLEELVRIAESAELVPATAGTNPSR